MRQAYELIHPTTHLSEAALSLMYQPVPLSCLVAKLLALPSHTRKKPRLVQMNQQHRRLNKKVLSHAVFAGKKISKRHVLAKTI